MTRFLTAAAILEAARLLNTDATPVFERELPPAPKLKPPVVQEREVRDSTPKPWDRRRQRRHRK